MMDWGTGGGDASFWQMGLFWLAAIMVLGLVVGLVAYFGPRMFRDGRTSQPGSGSSPAWQLPAADPKGILDLRLARGEIDVEEYRSRLAALAQAPAAGPSS